MGWKKFAAWNIFSGCENLDEPLHSPTLCSVSAQGRQSPPPPIAPLAPLLLPHSGAISPNYDCPHPEFIRSHSNSNAKIHLSKRPCTRTRARGGQVPQTAFPRVIRLSEPSPLSNLSPVALRGLNTRPAGNTTPLSVPECDTEPVYVSMHP